MSCKKILVQVGFTLPYFLCIRVFSFECTESFSHSEQRFSKKEESAGLRGGNSGHKVEQIIVNISRADNSKICIALLYKKREQRQTNLALAHILVLVAKREVGLEKGQDQVIMFC